ncbi:hypothetical protein Dimus_030800 [Dionaea muscipula]
MEQFRQIGEVLGSLNAMMVLLDDIRINQRQCCLLFDMFNQAFQTISDEIKQNLKLEEKSTKWKALEQPLRELYRVFKEGELYVRYCFDTRDCWWIKALFLHGDRDCVEFHIHNLLCYFPIVIEAIEIAGEISGLDLDEMQKRRTLMANKYDKVWNDPKLFQWKYGKQYLVSQEICPRLNVAWREDCWLLQETTKEKQNTVPSSLTKNEHRLGDLLVKKLNGSETLFPSSILTGAKDYQVRRRLGRGSQYKEILWLGESFALRHFFGEAAAVKPEIFSLHSLSHPNVIKYLCGFHEEEKKEYFLVMELMNKDLMTHIKEMCGPKRRLPFSLPVAVDIMLQIARGMEYLHSQKICHGHLNPSNILIKTRNSSTEGYIHVKISGFGLRSVNNVHSRCPSPPQENDAMAFIWHAPEVLAEQEKPGSNGNLKYSEKADVYSFAMLCFELLTGKVPFEDAHLQGDKMSRNIRAGVRPLFPFALPKCLALLTKRCWQTDPDQRPSFSSTCRILRYIKRLLIINPHLSRPEIRAPQVDVCDIEAGFLKKFPTGVASITHIPFQLFSFRLAEKEKLSGSNRDKNWESASEIVPSDENRIAADEASFLQTRDTRSVFSEIMEKKESLVKKHNGMVVADDSFLASHKARSVCPEISLRRTSSLKKPNGNVGEDPSSPTGRDAKSVCVEIPGKRVFKPLKKSTTLPSLHLGDTRSVCSEIPEKRPLLLRKCNSEKAQNDPGKARSPTNRRSLLNPMGRSVRITIERKSPSTLTQCNCKCKPAGHLTDSEIH